MMKRQTFIIDSIDSGMGVYEDGPQEWIDQSSMRTNVCHEDSKHFISHLIFLNPFLYFVYSLIILPCSASCSNDHIKTLSTSFTNPSIPLQRILQSFAQHLFIGLQNIWFVYRIMFIRSQNICLSNHTNLIIRSQNIFYQIIKHLFIRSQNLITRVVR